MALLELREIVAGYGGTTVLRNVSLEIPEGTLISLIGANGAGKTTLARTVSGLLPPRSGTVLFDGENITKLSAHRRAERGLGMVPEGRELFASMTVEENLTLGATARRGRDERRRSQEQVFELFPVLKARRSQRAGLMSGGEQQMLAIARGLMGKPRLLIIDELSLGLSPKLVSQLLGITGQLRREGLSMLLTEQNVRKALAVSDYAYVMAEGHVNFHGPANEIASREEVRRAYLGL